MVGYDPDALRKKLFLHGLSRNQVSEVLSSYRKGFEVRKGE
jgi:hypothetical protein